MHVSTPVPHEDTETTARPDGNDADLRYLQEASAALLPIMAACDAAAQRSTRDDVRALARSALTMQTDQLAAISECLLAWGRPDGTRPRTTAGEALVGLHGRTLDLALAARLTAHAHLSNAGARIEMRSGASRTARPIAERAIRGHDRQLSALDLLFPPEAENE